MEQDVRRSFVEFLEQRPEGRLPDVCTAYLREQNHAVEREHIERVLELGEGCIGIRQRDAGERTEPLRRIPDQLRGRFVHDPSELARLRLVAEVDAGCRRGSRCPPVPLHRALGVGERPRGTVRPTG